MFAELAGDREQDGAGGVSAEFLGKAHIEAVAALDYAETANQELVVENDIGDGLGFAEVGLGEYLHMCASETIKSALCHNRISF
jgi:hypothetical protein